MGADLLTSLLTAFQAVLSLGMHRAEPTVSHLFLLLATIEVSSLGIWWALSRDNSMGVLVSRVIVVGALMWLMQDWQFIVGSVQAGFMKLGLQLGGNHFELGTVHSAGSTLIAKGQELSLVIQGKVADPTWWQSLNYTLDAMAPTSGDMGRWIVSWMVALAFLIAGVHMFATQLCFVFFSAITFVTIPFAIWNRMAWLPERAFGSVMGTALKLAFLYMLASASIPVLQQYTAPVAPSQQDCIMMLGAGLLILFLQVAAHQLASGLLHGMPTLTHTDITPRPAAVIGIAGGAGSYVARSIETSSRAASSTTSNSSSSQRRP